MNFKVINFIVGDKEFTSMRHAVRYKKENKISTPLKYVSFIRPIREEIK
jgi:hypothetical protein